MQATTTNVTITKYTEMQKKMQERKKHTKTTWPGNLLRTF